MSSVRKLLLNNVIVFLSKYHCFFFNLRLRADYSSKIMPYNKYMLLKTLLYNNSKIDLIDFAPEISQGLEELYQSFLSTQACHQL